MCGPLILAAEDERDEMDTRRGQRKKRKGLFAERYLDGILIAMPMEPFSP
jgi:hypothetical protein